MKVRLAVLLILVSSAISYLMFHIMHDTLHTSLSREENDFIFDRLHTTRAIMEENRNYLEIIKKDIEWEGEHVKFPCYYLRILDGNNREMVGTPGMATQLPVQMFPPPSTDERSCKDHVVQAQNGRYYLLMTDAVTTASGGPGKLLVEIALDITSEVTIDEGNHKKLLVAGILRALLFAVVIVHIIRRVLRPLDEMVKISESVCLNRIAVRAEPEGWPKEVKRVAVSFNGMLDRLEDAFGRVSQCASSMAHELRTPINNILGEAEITLSKERSPEEYRSVLISGMEECQRLSSVINTLLFLARADNPKDSIVRAPFKPMEEIADIVDFYDPQIEEKSAVVSCSGSGVLQGDRLLFRQAVSNLLRNALNYAPRGVKVEITVKSAGEHLDVTVSDTGHGIDESDLPRIFDRFQRLGNQDSPDTEGFGLGLSIVRAIMDLHRGSISVASKPGEGTAITLHFPVGVATAKGVNDAHPCH